MRVAGAAALLVGTVACSAAPAFGGTILVRGGGPAGGYGGYAAYGGYATPNSQPATATQSAGVVLIDTVLPYQNAQAAGTGMVLTAAGQVLTNYHVVEGAGTITVTVAATGQSYRATVVGTDPSNDVALIQLAGASGLTTVKADDDQAQVGDAVTAVGNAGGTGTLTAAAGTISSLTSSVTAASEGSSSGTETLTLHGRDDRRCRGGRLRRTAVRRRGRGRRHRHRGLDRRRDRRLCHPDRASARHRGADPLWCGDQHRADRPGRLPRGRAEQRRVGLRHGYGYGYTGNASAASGATIGNVVSGTAAAGAGLQAGDVITSLNGHAVASAADVSAALVGANPGDQVSIGWTDQSGVAHTATVALGASPVA